MGFDVFMSGKIDGLGLQVNRLVMMTLDFSRDQLMWRLLRIGTKKNLIRFFHSCYREETGYQDNGFIYNSGRCFILWSTTR